MKIRVANAPVSWGIMEIEGWSPPLPAASFLDQLQSAGYTGTELGPYGYLPTDPLALGRELERRGLTLTSAFVPLRLKEPNLDLTPAETVARLLGALGARYLVLADALWPEREAIAGRVQQSNVRLSEAEWNTASRNLAAASQLASGFGLRSVFHHHAGTYIETPAEIARLLQAAPVGLCLDTGHYVYGGGDPVEALETFGARVEYLHFKDVDPGRLEAARKAGLGFLDGVRAGVFCPLGQGCVRLADLLDRLDKMNYDGWAVVEQDADPAGRSDPFQDALASREFLRSTLGL
ncbi:MAG: TIM barrel protein [Acidobacteria bacterium]|nr:TIM barrel protein [Acidobacteriota bacterium]MBI3469983.1 TIM barrel protein [Candidatus Solibacter usitatus]